MGRSSIYITDEIRALKVLCKSLLPDWRKLPGEQTEVRARTRKPVSSFSQAVTQASREPCALCSLQATRLSQSPSIARLVYRLNLAKSVISASGKLANNRAKVTNNAERLKYSDVNLSIWRKQRNGTIRNRAGPWRNSSGPYRE